MKPTAMMYALALAYAATGSVHADLYQRQPESWLYYQDPPKPEPAPAKKKPDPAAPAVPDAATAKETLKKLGDAYEEAFSKAVLNPTRENILAEMRAKKQLMDLTERFTDRYEQVSWQTPEFDYTLEHPQRTDGLWASGPVNQERRDGELRNAAQKYGLLYVFRSDCPYCRRFSPILKNFAARYGFTIVSVSLDGRGTDQFPSPIVDLAALKRRHAMPEVVPALYLVDPTQPEAAPIGFGVMNDDDLLQRVAANAGIQVNEGVVSQGVSNAMQTTGAQ